MHNNVNISARNNSTSKHQEIQQTSRTNELPFLRIYKTKVFKPWNTILFFFKTKKNLSKTRAVNLNITGSLIKEKTLQLSQGLGNNHFIASNSWLEKFKNII